MDRLADLVHLRNMAKGNKPRQYFREWRQHRGLTLEQAAERIGTTHATLSRIERGKLAFNDSTLEAIAGAYNVSPADLLVRDPSDPEGLWSIWDDLTPAQRVQGAQMLRIIVGGKTGTGG